MFQIDLAASGQLQLILPGGRSIDIPATVGGLEYIQKIIKDHHNGLKNQRGYIGTLPTQHAVSKHFADQFLKEKAKKTEEELALAAKAKAEKLGINLDKLEISI